MKSLIFLALLCCALAAPERYHVKLDNFDTMPLPEIAGIVDCLVYNLGCTPVSDAYRAVYPEVMHNACEYCTEEQKRAGYHFYNRIIKDLPKKYQDLSKKFDPDNKFYDNLYRVLEQSAQNETKV